MADVTVSQFAEVLKVPVERLLTQLDEAGIRVSGADDTITMCRASPGSCSSGTTARRRPT